MANLLALLRPEQLEQLFRAWFFTCRPYEPLYVANRRLTTTVYTRSQKTTLNKNLCSCNQTQIKKKQSDTHKMGAKYLPCM